MINKSKVRQSAVNLIYAVEENGGNLQDFDLKLFWEIELETETNEHRKALAKAILHCTRASADSAELLNDRADIIRQKLGELPAAHHLIDDLNRLQQRSDEFEAAVATLKYCRKSKRYDTTDQLALCCKEVLTLAQIVDALADNVVVRFADFPECRTDTQKLEAAIKRRRKLMSTCAALSIPETILGKPEYVNLVRSAELLRKLPEEAQSLALKVLQHKEQLNEILVPLLRHYSLERMDVVDRAIIYLALYELKLCKLDTPIVVSEATALAHEYSGGKSAPFIHGIISAAAAQ